MQRNSTHLRRKKAVKNLTRSYKNAPQRANTRSIRTKFASFQCLEVKQCIQSSVNVVMKPRKSGLYLNDPPTTLCAMMARPQVSQCRSRPWWFRFSSQSLRHRIGCPTDPQLVVWRNYMAEVQKNCTLYWVEAFHKHGHLQDQICHLQWQETWFTHFVAWIAIAARHLGEVSLDQGGPQRKLVVSVMLQAAPSQSHAFRVVTSSTSNSKLFYNLAIENVI